MSGRVLVQAAALAFVAVVALPSAARADVVEVTAAGLNVRSGPGMSHRVIGVVSRGQRFTVQGRSGAWVLIDTPRGRGYAYDGYLRAVSESGAVGTVTAAGLNVRSGPGTGYRVLGVVTRGTRIPIQETRGGWHRFPYQGRAGWVYSGYVSSSASSTPPPSGGGGGGSSVPTGRPTSRAGFIQLRASGEGFYSYTRSSRRWGRPAMVYGIERAAMRFDREDRARPRIGVGDISAQNGGFLLGHVSHRRGVDADVRPVRRDGGEGPLTIGSSRYSRSRTARAIALMRAEMRVSLVLFNDRGISGVRYYPFHHNHFHVRIR